MSCVPLKPGLIGQKEFESNAKEMEVKDRHGWTINKVVSFGSFHTSAFSLGWITKKGSESNNSIRWHVGFSYNASHESAKQKFAFKQYDGDGDSVEVFCAAHLATEKIRYSKNLSSQEVLNNKYEIELYQDGVLTKVNYSDESPTLVSTSKSPMTIVTERKFDKESKKIFYGVIFKQDNLSVAVVSLIGGGTVWIKNDLDPKQQLLVAALATALLVKPELSTGN